MNKLGILERFFNRSSKEKIESIMREKGIYDETKKSKTKKELLPDFLTISDMIDEEELNDFIESAVFVKTKGLPIYTHKLSNKKFFEKKSLEDFQKAFNILSRPFTNKYSITTNLINNNDHYFEIKFIVKEYEDVWKNGELNNESLSAMYICKVTINLEKNVVTIICGDDNTHKVMHNFISVVFGLPLQSYSIQDKQSNLSWEQNASYKTALFLDFINNRLKVRGIESTFSYLKFKVGNTDIKDVTINGKDIISSYLACEYVVLGKDIVNFRVNMIKDGSKFSCNFELKTTNLDILKIVILDSRDEEFKNEIMDIIQTEYILMCENGMLDSDNTISILEEIYIKYGNKDKLFNETLENNITEFSKSLIDLLDDLNKNDHSKKEINKIKQNIQVLFETLKISNNADSLKELALWLDRVED